MQIKNEIYIYSDTIKSGKTTRVLAWINNQEGVFGILTPDVADKRRLYDISKRQLFEFEVDNETEETTISVGKFIFLNNAFGQAKEILKNSFHQKPVWLIIDEIGKLEIDDKGLEPELSSILTAFSKESPQTKILLIIRDTLLEAAIEKYQLQKAKVVDYTYFLTPLNLFNN